MTQIEAKPWVLILCALAATVWNILVIILALVSSEHSCCAARQPAATLQRILHFLYMHERPHKVLKLICSYRENYTHTDVWKVAREDRKHTPTHSVRLSEHSGRPAPGQPESTCLPDSSLVARLVVKALLWHHQRQTAARGHSCLQQSQQPLQTIHQSHILQKKKKEKKKKPHQCLSCGRLSEHIRHQWSIK